MWRCTRLIWFIIYNRFCILRIYLYTFFGISIFDIWAQEGDDLAPNVIADIAYTSGEICLYFPLHRNHCACWSLLLMSTWWNIYVSCKCDFIFPEFEYYSNHWVQKNRSCQKHVIHSWCFRWSIKNQTNFTRLIWVIFTRCVKYHTRSWFSNNSSLYLTFLHIFLQIIPYLRTIFIQNLFIFSTIKIWKILTNCH